MLAEGTLTRSALQLIAEARYSMCNLTGGESNYGANADSAYHSYKVCKSSEVRWPRQEQAVFAAGEIAALSELSLATESYYVVAAPH